MTGLNGGEEHGGCGTGAAMTVARPVVLVRSRRGTVGQAARTVHLIPVPAGRTGTVSAMCGAILSIGDIEIVNPGQGMPCTACVLNHVAGTSAERPAGSADRADSAGLMGGTTYRAWGWPVAHHRDRVRLCLHHNVSAIAIPILAGTEIIQILIARRCVPPVMAHPSYPEHHILLAGERYGVTLPWPVGVHPVTGAVSLPPSLTRGGPVLWIRPPQADSLRLCREIDIFAALRTVLNVSRCPRPSPDWRETVGRNEEDKDNNKDNNDDDVGRHRDEDNTGDGSHDRPIPPPPDPNKHDR